jgi:predicted RNase H-related nuclease YkuK (DUF458 family)
MQPISDPDAGDRILFQNTRQKDLTFEEVYLQLAHFIREEPMYQYRLSIGTDSQVSRTTVFATAIHLHRVGRGAIGFITSKHVPRPIHSLREKIYYETSRTLEIAYLFTPDKIENIIDIFASRRTRRGDIDFEFHLDIGTTGATRSLISEMVAMTRGTVFEPKIKPESYAASAYANRYTKGKKIPLIAK